MNFGLWCVGFATVLCEGSENAIAGYLIITAIALAICSIKVRL